MGHSSARIGPSESLRANGPGPRIVGPHKPKLKFDLKIKIEFELGLVAIEFGFEYRFANSKSSTLIEFEIYNNFENCLVVGANTRNFFF